MLIYNFYFINAFSIYFYLNFLLTIYKYFLMILNIKFNLNNLNKFNSFII